MRTHSVVFGEYMAMSMEARALAEEWSATRDRAARTLIASRLAVANGMCYLLLVEFNALCNSVFKR